MFATSISHWKPMFRRLRIAVLAVVLAVPLAGIATAVDQDDVDESEHEATGNGATPKDRPAQGKRGLGAKTLGGRQFWADVEFFRRWRIQQNVITGHFRLLDGEDCRWASGSKADCRGKLAEVGESQGLEPMSGEAVILIHGLVRSSKSMRTLAQHLEDDADGLQTFSFTYPSTRVDIAQAARYLNSAIESLEGIERIHFVAHSMGGLVVRAWAAEHSDPRIGRLVMIATPNMGAELAERNTAYRVVLGPAGQQLTPAQDGFIAKLPTPEFEFGVIAGGNGESGYNPFIQGDNDGTVSVASTRLAGAADFVVVDRLHTFIVSAPETAEYTARFLKTGRFRTSGDPEPVPREDVAGTARATDSKEP
jgi:pimeloyl-ACP methyl ester carboxylesterase